MCTFVLLIQISRGSRAYETLDRAKIRVRTFILGKMKVGTLIMCKMIEGTQQFFNVYISIILG